MSTELMIEADNVTKRYDKVTALDGVSVSAAKGSVLGLLGQVPVHRPFVVPLTLLGDFGPHEEQLFTWMAPHIPVKSA